ncbi:MAG: 16S rRNA (cytosine(1402)-N(4))-methyltransferase RsmH [Calditrichia bacterium]
MVEDATKFYHQPVLKNAALDYWYSDPEGVYVDCTLGGGGHAEALLHSTGFKGVLLGLDADEAALEFAGKRLDFYDRLILRQVFYDQLDIVLVEEDLLPVSGFLFDLGISSRQIDDVERGFSFQSSGPLDMRFGSGQKTSARQVVNDYPEEKLQILFREYGEERHWRRIAAAVVKARLEEEITTTSRLSEVVGSVVPGRFRNKTLARIFQAIRIEVNDELHRLERALQKAFDCLSEGGRMVVISYHSLEDRLVKQFFRFLAQDCICPPEFPFCQCGKQSEVKLLTRKPVQPDSREIEQNSRARSARLRAAQKTVPYRSLV